MSQFMGNMKEWLKKFQFIVVLYETVVCGVKKIKKKIFGLLERVLPYTLYMSIQILDYRITTKDKTKMYAGPYFYKWRPLAKKKYCIIRFQLPDHALFAAGRQYIYAAEYAKSKGMHPLLDIEWGIDFEKGILGKENAWESIFTQRKIQDVLKENATILVSAYAGRDMCLPETCFDINEVQTDDFIHATEEKWREYYMNLYKYVDKYWKFNENFLHKIDRKISEVLENGEKVLGVSLREEFSSEYYSLIEKEDVRTIFKRHPLGPDVSEVIEIVEGYLDKWNCEKIFLTTRYDSSIKMFESRFPGRIIYMKRKRYTNIAEEATLVVNSKKSWEEPHCGINFSEESKDYAQEMLLLSKCTYLIGAKSGGTIAALMLNGGQYKDIKLLEDKRQIDRY